jgi:hypothetical protein
MEDLAVLVGESLSMVGALLPALFGVACLKVVLARSLPCWQLMLDDTYSVKLVCLLL